MYIIYNDLIQVHIKYFDLQQKIAWWLLRIIKMQILINNSEVVREPATQFSLEQTQGNGTFVVIPNDNKVKILPEF